MEEMLTKAPGPSEISNQEIRDGWPRSANSRIGLVDGLQRNVVNSPNLLRGKTVAD